MTAGRDRRWVRYALNYVRGSARADRDRHRALRSRFAKHWDTLEKETWRPFAEAAVRNSVHRYGTDGLNSLRAITLEAAYWWAHDIEMEPAHGAQLHAAAKELADVDKGIQSAAQDLSELLVRRSELRGNVAISSAWLGALDYDTRDRLDLWDIIDLVSALPQYQAWAASCEHERESFLYSARGRNEARPALRDVMACIAEASPRAPVAEYSEDREILSKTIGTKADSWAERVRTFFQQMADEAWDTERGKTVSALGCLTARMISPLLCVASGNDPYQDSNKALMIEAVEKALQRFRAAT